MHCDALTHVIASRNGYGCLRWRVTTEKRRLCGATVMSVWLCERIATPIILIEARQPGRACFSLMTHLHRRGTSRQQQRMWGTESHSAQLCVRQAVVPAPPKGGTLGTQASQQMCANCKRAPRTHTRRTRGCHADSNMWGTEVHSALRTLGQAAQCASTTLSKTAIENGNETSKQHSIQRLCGACGVTRLPNMTTDRKCCLLWD